MTNKIKTILAVLSLTCFASTAAFSADFLADKHKAAGLSCADCHGDKDKRDGVDVDRCLSCHESFEKLKLSAKTKKYDPNPHAGHYVDLDCNNCHHGHKALEIYCDQCHKKI